MSKSSERVAISKKMRFEIFKRDSFTCRYCGKTPPDVTLVIDHVVPVSGGGPTVADNLSTSCAECNQGKAGNPLNVLALGDMDKMARLQERLEDQRLGQEAVKAEKARKKLRQVMTNILCDTVGSDTVQKQNVSGLCRLCKEFGVDKVIEFIELASSRIAHVRERDCMQYVYGCARKIREELAAHHV